MVHSLVFVSGMRIPPPAQREAPARRGFAMALMIVSSVVISFGGLISRLMEDADPTQINFYRSLSLCVTFGLVFAYNHRASTVRDFRKVGWSGVLASLCLMVAGIAFMQALAHTTVANTMFTLASIPFLTAALAWVFLRENLTMLTVITMCAAAVGVALMVMDGIGLGSIYGNLMALITALGFSGFAVIVRRNRHIDMMPALLISAVAIVVISLALRYDDLTISWWDIAMCIIWGGALSGIGNCLFIIASRHLVAGELTLFMLLEFALSPLWVWIVVRETPSHWALAGGSLVILAVATRALLEMNGKTSLLKRGRPSPI
ncbi:MAG: DMT family transporter [Alphaproteobacteria bacterium]|nr:DMT family transporter [Alphaproteobacteria bacterium]